ncbi:MAG TPA: porin [Gammaproteobacteria bacterium]|nr:porin [Gammaproteobacteria bacterium]
MVLATVAPATMAYGINDNFSIGGVLAAAEQCQNLNSASEGVDNECKGGMSLQLEMSLRPDDRNELYLKLGFGIDHTLNEISPWNLAPWAADLESDVLNINGLSRNYLMAAWYKHTVTFENENALSASIGILDSTDYLDSNVYSNDEYTQFMNQIFVNNGSYGLPSYDAGAALEWKSGSWSVNALGINVGENDDGNNYNFWGAQAAYQADSSLGVGNYRVILVGTSSNFLDPSGTNEEDRLAWGFSLDQAFGDVVGAFLRVAWQSDDAAIDYKALYSGGLDFNGNGWGRETDNIGVGYAYLPGGNIDLNSSQIFEIYYRYSLIKNVGITADVQYMKDNYSNSEIFNDDTAGWVFGLRLTAEF